MLGGESAHRAAYRPSTCSSSSGSRRQVRPVSMTGTSAGPGRPVDGVADRLAELVDGAHADEARPGKLRGWSRGRSAAKTRAMTLEPTKLDPSRDPALDRAHEHARRWLASLDDRPVSPQADADAIDDALGRELPEGPTPPEDVVDLLATACEPGLVGDAVRPLLRLRDRRLAAGRAGGRLAGQRLGPEHRAAQGHPGRRRRSRRSRPPGSSTCSGCPPGAASASPPARRWRTSPGWRPAATRLLTRRGLGPHRGLAGSPPLRVLAGQERHTSADLALRYLGLPAAELVDADEQGRIVPDALRARAGRGSRPADDRAAAGRQPALRGVRPVRGVHRARARARRLGARRRRVRAVGGGLPVVPPPHRGRRARGLLGDRRAQDAERALRLRHRRRP